MKKIWILLLAGCLLSCVFSKTQDTDNFRLNLVHTNDLHSHLLPFNDLNDCDLDSDCLGGLARVTTFLKKEKSENTLILDAGDRFTGTAFYTLFKSRYLLPLFQNMPYDAITLGNHEFDDNLPETVSFLQQWDVPVILANLDISPQEVLADRIKPSIVIEKGGKKIGIIGLLTQETIVLDNPDISVLPVLDILSKEIGALKEKGVNIIIVLSHIGLNADKQLAEKFPEIDIIVGGHSHTLLSNNKDISNIGGPYPIAMNQGKTLIVSSGMGGRFVGKLQADFNTAGEIVAYRGNTIAMDNQFSNDPVAKAIIEEAREALGEALGEEIGTLDREVGFTPGTDYCSENCSIGTFLAEVLYSAYPAIDGVLLNAGSIRRGLPKGRISYRHLIETYPFDNEAILIQLTGKELTEFVAHGIANYHTRGKTNEMLQTAGVAYHFSKEDKKITDITINEKKVSPDRVYTLLVSAFLAKGGDGYPPKAYQKTGYTVREILKKQMKHVLQSKEL